LSGIGPKCVTRPLGRRRPKGVTKRRLHCCCGAASGMKSLRYPRSFSVLERLMRCRCGSSTNHAATERWKVVADGRQEVASFDPRGRDARSWRLERFPRLTMLGASRSALSHSNSAVGSIRCWQPGGQSLLAPRRVAGVVRASLAARRPPEVPRQQRQETEKHREDEALYIASLFFTSF